MAKRTHGCRLDLPWLAFFGWLFDGWWQLTVLRLPKKEGVLYLVGKLFIKPTF
jgi:hypothetical protein